MSWNPVFDWVMEVKRDYREMCGDNFSFSYYSGKTFFEDWLKELNDPHHNEIAKYLTFSSKDEFLLIRYISYQDLYKINSDVTLDNLWNLHNGFYKECRSIVIDCRKDEIALCPFQKFFNLNEGEENQVENVKKEIENAVNVEFSNKLDGSMVSASWYNDDFLVATSQSVNPLTSWRLERATYILKGHDKWMDLLKEYKDWTFIFEYISLDDPHTVVYTKEQEGLYLIGIRFNKDGWIAPYHSLISIAKEYSIPTTTVYNKTFDEVLEDIKTIKSSEQEGFVLNIDGRLIKIKGDDYVYMHKIFSKIAAPNMVVQAIADEKYDDFLAKIPTAYHSRVKEITHHVNRYCADFIVKVYAYYGKICYDLNIENKNFLDKKQFMTAVNESEKKQFMIAVNEIVPKEYRHYVRNLYLGNKNNYLKSQNGRYKKYTEILSYLESIQKGDNIEVSRYTKENQEKRS